MDGLRMKTKFSMYPLLLILLIFLLPNMATADIITSGDIDPFYDDTDPWIISPEDLIIGNTAIGSIEINSDSWIDDVNGFIGFAQGSSGTVTVTGQHSEWNNAGELYVGYEGTGVMNILDSGRVGANLSFGNSTIGFGPNSKGTVTVSGGQWVGMWDPSIWVFSVGDLVVGYEGDGTLLIEKGGLVLTNSVYIGNMPGSVGEVTVTGKTVYEETGGLFNGAYQGRSKLDVDSKLVVGVEGEGTLKIEDGGYVIGPWGFIGDSLGSRGSVTVTGRGFYQESTDVDNTDTQWIDGSQWIIMDNLFVGNEGDGTLSIEDGGYVSNTNGYIGYMPGSTGSVTVTGGDIVQESAVEDDDLEWTISGSEYIVANLFVGYEGDGVMEVNDGGHVTSVEAQIGSLPGSRGRVTVTGQDSRWDSTSIEVGGIQRDPITSEIFRGGTGLLSINNGGTVTSTEISVGGYTYDPITEDIGPGEMGLLNISNGGTLISNVQIHPSGILSGDGLISGSVMNTGAIKPGNSIGTLTIDGSLMMGHEFYPYSIYEVEVDNSGNSDLLSVTGEVFIVGGTVQAVSTETISGSQQYTIIEATNVTGTFDTLDTSLLRTGLFPKVSLDYGTDSVLLQIEATAFDDPSVVQTDNQSSLGRALQRIAGGGGNSIINALKDLKNADQVRSAYEQLSGQISPQLMPVTAVDTGKFMGIVSDRLNYTGAGLSYYGFSSGTLLAMADPDKTGENASTSDTSPNFALGNGTTTFGDQEWGFWGRGYGVFGERDTGGEVAGYDYTVYGTTFGLDYQITDSTLLGITAGYSSGDVDSSLAGSKSDMSGTNIGIYGNKNMDDWHFDAILTYSFLEYETERVVNLMSEKLKGDTDGQGISGYLEARYDWRDLYSWLLQPLASFQLSYLDMDGYTESGGVSSLGYDDQSYNSYKGSLGMKASRELFKRDNDLRANIQLRGRWIHEFGDDNSSVDAHFASDPGAVFKVSDEDISRDSALLGVGLNADLNRRIRLMLGYDAQLNNDDNVHILSAMFVYRW